MKRLLVILVGTMLLAGCGSKADPRSWFRKEVKLNPPTPLTKLDNEIRPRVVWSVNIGDTGKETGVQLVPKVVGERVFIADTKGSVRALSAADGRSLWSVDLKAPITGGPGMGDGLVLLGTGDARVIALNVDTGEKAWEVKVSSEVLSAPAAGLGRVIVHTGDGKILGLSSQDGKEVWRYERAIPILSLRGSSAPVIRGTSVFCGMAGGKLLALDVEKGTPVWEMLITVPGGRSELDRLADVDGDPWLTDDAVYAATYQGDVAAVGQFTGRLIWRRKLSSYTTVSADWRQVYVADDTGLVWALDANNGSSRWQQEGLKGRKLSAPAVVGNYVVVGDFEGYLHWLSVDDGRMLARTRVGFSPIRSQPRVHDNLLYVMGSAGDLDVISLPEN